MRKLLGVSFVGLLVTAILMLFTSLIMGLIFEEAWVRGLFNPQSHQAIQLWGYPALFVVYFLMAAIMAGGLKWLEAEGALSSLGSALFIGGAIIVFRLVMRVRAGEAAISASAVTDGVIILSVLAVAGVVLSQFRET